MIAIGQGAMAYWIEPACMRFCACMDWFPGLVPSANGHTRDTIP